MHIVVAILVLGILIVIHEFGHFIVAKLSGVGVLKFSVGFGPTLFGRTVEGTEYVVSAVPLGGFVKMVGEDPDSEEPVNEKISFSHQPLWKRSAIVLAGPVFNLVFAFILFSAVYSIYGIPSQSEQAKIGVVKEGTPAEKAGIAVDDVVAAVDGTKIASWVELSEAIRESNGRTLRLEIQRGTETLQLPVTPEQREDKNVYGEAGPSYFAIGILGVEQRRPAGVAESIQLGAASTLWWMKTMVVSVYKMLRRDIPAGEIGGVILIVQQAGNQAKAGFEALAMFMAVISINLGVLNLLPIPVLDGGHLLFIGIEAVMRRPLNVRQREMAQQVGLVILIGIMAFAFYNDFGRILRGWG